jgi:phosphopentomutase
MSDHPSEISRPDRVILIVLDSVGIGELPDAGRYGDSGSNTVGNIARVAPMKLPALESIGLGHVVDLGGGRPAPGSIPLGAYARMAEVSPGKDSVTGHWELMGLVLDHAFPVFPDGFPAPPGRHVRRAHRPSAAFRGAARNVGGP